MNTLCVCLILLLLHVRNYVDSFSYLDRRPYLTAVQPPCKLGDVTKNFVKTITGMHVSCIPVMVFTKFFVMSPNVQGGHTAIYQDMKKNLHNFKCAAVMKSVFNIPTD